MNITDVDKNFKAENIEDIKFNFYDALLLNPEGFPWKDENENKYNRLPQNRIPKREDIHKTNYLKFLSTNTAGGVLRFCTDSSVLKLKGEYGEFHLMEHMPLTCQAGFDICVYKDGEEHFLANLRGNIYEIAKKNFSFEASCSLPGEMTEYRIYFPLYAPVKELLVGIEGGKVLENPPKHKVEKAILFYAGSVTQGGCASRPSNCYSALLSKWVDAEQINLGFSGNALGEKQMAELIAELDLSCFVMSYDNNAPTAKYLEKTHEPFFRIIREKHPNLPVIFVSRPCGNIERLEETKIRRDIIKKTYLNALNDGDKNVYFVEGLDIFAKYGYDGATVDKSHPTDLGFLIMAEAILPSLKKALKIK